MFSMRRSAICSITPAASSPWSRCTARSSAARVISATRVGPHVRTVLERGSPASRLISPAVSPDTASRATCVAEGDVVKIVKVQAPTKNLRQDSTPTWC
jgi:hypothetical protein